MDDNIKNFINPNHIEENNAFLGTFGDDIDDEFCEPLFNLNELGISEGIQTDIQNYFDVNGKFKGTLQRNDLIETLFVKLKDAQNDLDKDKLDKAKTDMTTNLAIPLNTIAELLSKYEKGPEKCFENIFGITLYPVGAESLKVSDKVRMIRTGKEGFITKVWRKKDIIALGTSVDPKTKICDIVISSQELTEQQKTLAIEANKAFKLGNYETLCNNFENTFAIFDVVKPTQVFKTDFRKIVRKTIRAIIEKPGPPTQCKNAFRVNGAYYDQKEFDNNDPMYCYICFKNLKTAPDIPANRRECEHIFPITESQLVWGTLLNSFFDNNDDDKHIANLKRLYAPVCNHCNISPHKSNIRVLDFDDGKFIINPELIKALVKNCSGCRNYQTDNKFSGVGITTPDEHKVYLKAVFQPLVNAVNKDIKFHLGKAAHENIEDDDAGEILDLFLCRYLFYFDDKALRDIKILLVGGEDAVAVQKKLDESNEFIEKVIRRIYNIIENTRTVLQVRFSPTLTKSEKKLKNTASSSSKGLVGVAAAAVARRFATAKKALIKRVADLKYMHNIKYRKNLEMWRYFKIECKEYFKNGEVSARNYQSIYNYIISNKDNSINYLTHFNLTNDDINKLNQIAGVLKTMKTAAHAGGGKKPKFIQSGGTITQKDADEVFWHGLIEYDEPELNSVSFLLPKFLEISDFLNAPFTNEEKEEEKKLDDLCRSFECEKPKDNDEVKDIINEDIEKKKTSSLRELVNSLASTIEKDLFDIQKNNETFYMNLLEDIFNNMNYKFGGLDRNEVVACVSSDLTIRTEEELEENVEGATPLQNPHRYRIYRNPRKHSDDSDEELDELPDLDDDSEEEAGSGEEEETEAKKAAEEAEAKRIADEAAEAKRIADEAAAKKAEEEEEDDSDSDGNNWMETVD